MKLDEKIISRLDELVEKGEAVLKTYRSGSGSSGGITWSGRSTVNSQISYEWGTSCLNILANVFGKEGERYKLFNNTASQLQYYDLALKALGILKAAKDDYENSYLFDTRTLIEGEVFDEFLEQAEELFKKNYYQAAAVIAGCVLEDGLRKLGQRKIPSFPTDKTIDPMNVELAKAGIHTKLVQKKITHLADLRNKAAHGKWTEFTEKDVEDMIRDVRRFMEDYFS